MMGFVLNQKAKNLGKNKFSDLQRSLHMKEGLLNKKLKK